MVRVRTVLSLVSASAVSSSLITLRHNRGRRPAQRTRTPQEFISSRRRRITSRLKPISQRTSSGERRQFSVEKAYAEMCFTPISMPPATTSSSEASPISWPLTRGSPRALAQRPLPSITIATWPGTNSAGIAGGRAPDGCGGGEIGGSRGDSGRTCDRRRTAINSLLRDDVRGRCGNPLRDDVPHRDDVPLRDDVLVRDDVPGLPGAAERLWPAG